MSNQLQISNIKKNTQVDLLEIELILSFVINKPREFIVAHPKKKLTTLQAKKFLSLINKRKKGVPLAYLTGHKEFYGLDFLVNKNVLIPRPDTEILVETVIDEINRNKEITKKIKRSKDQKIILIDVGTGSGCIPIAILKTLQNKNNPITGQWGNSTMRQLDTFAIDISPKALEIAKSNAKKHQVKIKFLHGNLLTPFLKPCSMFHIPCSMFITANLPYLSEKQYHTATSIKFEPKKALVAQKNGLALYEKLLKQIAKFPVSIRQPADQFPVTIFFEFDSSQTNALKSLINQYLPEAKIEIKKDLAGRDRVAIFNL